MREKVISAKKDRTLKQIKKKATKKNIKAVRQLKPKAKQVINKRKEQRLFTLIDGDYESDAKHGCLMFTNINEVGCGVSLNQEVFPGDKIKFEMRFPGAPVQAIGQVIWTKKRKVRNLYNTDAGIKLEKITSIDKQRIMKAGNS